MKANDLINELEEWKQQKPENPHIELSEDKDLYFDIEKKLVFFCQVHDSGSPQTMILNIDELKNALYFMNDLFTEKAKEV